MSQRPHVGNWHEEMVSAQDRQTMYQEARANGRLLSQQIVAKARTHKAVTTLSPLQEHGLLRFGDVVMLQSASTKGFLSIDLDDSYSNGVTKKYVPSTAAAAHPMLRNSFVLMPVPCAEDRYFEANGEADIVHYGQKFILKANSGLHDGLYLASERQSPSSYSKVTKNQEVYYSTQPKQHALWSLTYADPEFRFEMVGRPVKANSIVVMMHCFTNLPLASTESRFANDFGAECEVCCKKHLAVKCKNGQSAETAPNFFAFVTAPPSGEANKLEGEEQAEEQAAAAEQSNTEEAVAAPEGNHEQ